MSVARTDHDSSIAVLVILCKLEFQVAHCNCDLRISESFDSIGADRCPMIVEEERQVTANSLLEIRVSTLLRESPVEYASQKVYLRSRNISI
jgi:hypothetical protein